MAKRFSSPSGPSQRQRRAGELIRHVLAEIIQRGEVHDEGMPKEPITISEVKASPDLRNATVYCTVLGRDDASAAVDALNRVAGKIRAVLGTKIDLKFTPALHFSVDTSFGEAARIDDLLAQAGRGELDE